MAMGKVTIADDADECIVDLYPGSRIARAFQDDLRWRRHSPSWCVEAPRGTMVTALHHESTNLPQCDRTEHPRT